MLYNFLSESSVLDITLLALGSGIIVLSILGLLHLVKRRGRNKTGHFSEQTDDCAIPAVQMKNSDGWPLMEQPQTPKLAFVVAAPEDSSNPDSPPSETVVSLSLIHISTTNGSLPQGLRAGRMRLPTRLPHTKREHASAPPHGKDKKRTQKNKRHSLRCV